MFIPGGLVTRSFFGISFIFFFCSTTTAFIFKLLACVCAHFLISSYNPTQQQQQRHQRK